MTREEATKQATEIANRDGIAMVVTENPYAEHESERISYYPAKATAIFKMETVLETISPG